MACDVSVFVIEKMKWNIRAPVCMPMLYPCWPYILINLHQSTRYSSCRRVSAPLSLPHLHDRARESVGEKAITSDLCTYLYFLESWSFWTVTRVCVFARNIASSRRTSQYRPSHVVAIWTTVNCPTIIAVHQLKTEYFRISMIHSCHPHWPHFKCVLIIFAFRVAFGRAHLSVVTENVRRTKEATEKTPPKFATLN